MKRCPYCEASISATAKKCRHCGEWVVTYSPPGGAVARPGTDPEPQQIQVVDNRPGSVAFAVITLLCYLLSIFLFPLYLIAGVLNLVGLLTGPRRGCFFALMLLFLAIPLGLVFLGASFGVAVLDGLLQSIRGLIGG